MTSFTGYYPRPSTIKALVDGCFERTTSLSGGDVNLFSSHNAFTDYCLALLMCCTGHRPVDDPFAELSQFDLERGLLLICDKVVDETRAWRAVALSELAVAQVRVYLKHLQRLSGCLQARDSSRELGARIKRLSGSKADMPLFFYLNESQPDSYVPISSAALSSEWSAFWILPINFLRHVMATELLRTSGRPDLVQLQLGHTEGVDYPLGSKSTVSVLAAAEIIRKHIDGYLRESGWRVMEAPPLASLQACVPGIGQRASRNALLFGHRKREEKRKGVHAKSKELVKALVSDHLAKFQSIDADGAHRLVEHLVATAQQRKCPINRCLRLFYRYLARRKGGKDLIKHVLRVRQIEVEPSPFTDASLAEYRDLVSFRAAFIAHLDNKGRRDGEVDASVRLAEIVCAAALFGGIAAEARLRLLASAVLLHTHRISAELSVDIPLGGSAVFRWHPDPVSSALIEGLFRKEGFEAKVSEQKLQASIAALLESIGCGGGSLALLEKLSQAALLFEMPGYIAECLRGEIAAVSVPLNAWVRATADRAIATPATHLSTPGAFNPDQDWAPDLRHCRKEAKLDLREARSFALLIRKLISQAVSLPTTGNMKVSTRRKKYFAEILKSTFDREADWSILPLLIVGWAVHLCEHGTRTKKYLAYSTIDKYLMLIVRHLTPAACGADVLNLDEAGFEELYLKVVETTDESRRYELASRLREFHYFLVQRFGMDELSWAGIMAAAGGLSKPAYTDANFLTATEYRDALQVVLSDDGLSERVRIQYGGMLFFGYRFGLRFGEALRLEYRDIQLDAGEIILWVRNTAHGDTKTSSSVRIVHLAESLDDVEKQLIERLVGAAGAVWTEGASVPLMSETAGLERLIDRHLTARYLNTLLRSLTGDETLRFHHLRHGWVSRIVGRTEAVKLPGFADEAMHREGWGELVGADALYPLRSVMVATGHADERTTLASYTHCIDQVAHAHLRASSPALSDFALAYSLQIAYATVRRRRARGPFSGRKVSFIPLGVDTRKRVRKVPSILSNTTSPKEHIHLEEVDLLLRQVRYTGRDIRSLASRLFLSQERAEALQSKATRVELESGYTGYDLIASSSDPITRLSASNLKSTQIFHSETERLKKLLRGLEARRAGLSEQDGELWLEGLASWVRSANVKTPLCVVSGMRELESLLRLFCAMDIGIKASALINDRDEKLKHEIQQLGVKIKSTYDARGVRSKGVTGGVAIDLEPSPQVGPVRSLQRLLFLLAVAELN